MKRGTFDTILSFLLGFAWAMLFIGSWLVFKITALFGLPLAFLATLVFMFWSLLCILLLEGLNLYKERAETLKEQTRLLRRIAGLLEKGA
jgi:hypothetical protein